MSEDNSQLPVFGKRAKIVLEVLMFVIIGALAGIILNYYFPPQPCKEPTGILLRTVEVTPLLQNFTFTQRGITIEYIAYPTNGFFAYLGYEGSGSAPSVIMIYETHPHIQEYLNAHAVCADAIILSWQDTLALGFNAKDGTSLTYTVKILTH